MKHDYYVFDHIMQHITGHSRETIANFDYCVIYDLEECVFFNFYAPSYWSIEDFRALLFRQRYVGKLFEKSKTPHAVLHSIITGCQFDLDQPSMEPLFKTYAEFIDLFGERFCFVSVKELSKREGESNKYNWYNVITFRELYKYP